MKRFIQFFMMSILLIVTLVANSTPSQQSSNGLTKEIVHDNISPYTAPNDGQHSIPIETVSLFDGDSSLNFIDAKYKAAVDRLKQQSAFIKGYAKANHFNTQYCFLVDMSIPSGKKRFFVYNINKDTIEYSSLVAHGWGSETTHNDQLEFSNTPNSCQTSLGKYKVGYSYKGAFGQAYKLYGLDNTNSKAFERVIVLHSLSQVPDSETYPDNICHSAGCPMVSPSSLAILGNYIKSSPKPILLWIYN